MNASPLKTSTLKVAPAALLVEFIRVAPGEDKLCLPDPLGLNEQVFFVLGEWDLLRLSLVNSFFPRAKDVEPWPPLDVQVLNSHSFLAHIWEECPTLGAESDRRSVTSSILRAIDYPLLLLICIKLDPRVTHSHGIRADWSIVHHVLSWAVGRDLIILPAGSIGWQELIFLVRARSLDTARELVRDLFELPATSLFSDLPVTNAFPVVSRSITYSCILASEYFSQSEPLQATNFQARILLSRRPGIRHPLVFGASERGTIANLEGDSNFPRNLIVTERFGEYDLELDSAGEQFDLNALRKLRESNSWPEYKSWLHGSSTVVEFKPPLGSSRDQAFNKLPLRYQLAATAIRAAVRQFRWYGVENLDSERLISLLHRVASYSADPCLSESVEPLSHYFNALGQQVGEASRDIASSSLEHFADNPVGIWIEPTDMEEICGLLEFCLRQRLEGVQQFLFNAMPNSYYGRGGLNRVLLGADTILQEVSNLFDIENPGFVVFGMPSLDGFATFGPIVTAPIFALFALEWWWVIYHEAAVYIDVHLFNPDVLGPSFVFMREIKETKKLVPDLLTLALPFKFDASLFSLMHAKRLASVSMQRAESATASVALRLASVVLFRSIARTLRGEQIGELGLEGPLAGASKWIKSLELNEKQLGSDSPIRDEISAALAGFVNNLLTFSPDYRRSRIPNLASLIESDIFSRLATQCQIIRRFWSTACEEARRQNGDRRSLLAIGYLARALGGIEHETTTVPAAGEVPLGARRVSDLVYEAMKRWERSVWSHGSTENRDVAADIDVRLAESLAAWHTGATRRTCEAPLTRSDAMNSRVLGPVIMRRNLQQIPIDRGKYLFDFSPEYHLGESLIASGESFYPPASPHTAFGEAWKNVGWERFGRFDYLEDTSPGQLEEEQGQSTPTFPSRALVLRILGNRSIEPEVLDEVTVLLRQRLSRMFGTLAHRAAARSESIVHIGRKGKFEPLLQNELLERVPFDLYRSSEILDALFRELIELVETKGIKGNWGQVRFDKEAIWIEIEVPDTFSRQRGAEEASSSSSKSW